MEQLEMLIVELHNESAKEDTLNVDLISNLMALKDQVTGVKRVDGTSSKVGIRELKSTDAFRKVVESVMPKQIHTCYVCKDGIEENGIKFKNEYYHDHHFTCAVCYKIMRGLQVFHIDNKLLCEDDYHKLYSHWCEYCKEIIKDGGIEACNKHFCDDHFFCSQCGMDLSSVQYFEYKGKAFCERDYGNFAERCQQCGLPMLEAYITCAEKNYHPSCLVCSIKGCTNPLNTSSLYVDDGKAYCEKHFYAKMDGVCTQCNEIIVGRCVIFQNKRYHPLHFKCSFCHTSLDERGYKAKAEKPYCGDCYVKLFN